MDIGLSTLALIGLLAFIVYHHFHYKQSEAILAELRRIRAEMEQMNGRADIADAERRYSVR